MLDTQASSLKFITPRDVEPSVDSVVVERRAVLELIIEAQPRGFANWSKVAEVERAHVAICHRIVVESVVTSVDVISAAKPVCGEEMPAGSPAHAARSAKLKTSAKTTSLLCWLKSPNL